VPPSSHTYVTIGQDLFSIQDYVTRLYNYSLEQQQEQVLSKQQVPLDLLDDILPAAFMSYTDLYSLRGLDQPADYGSGIEYANGLLDLTNNNGLQLGLWLNGTLGCRDIISGALDAQIQRLLDYLMASPFKKIFLRVAYEFDNPQFGFTDDPRAYQLAFQTLVQYCIQQYKNKCRDKIAFVWHSFAADTFTNLTSYWPGDDYVDWVAVSLFSQRPKDKAVTRVLDFARHHSKPVMIAESSPFGNSYHDVWKEWFVPVLQLIEKHDIGMWSYIHCDWNSQPMWQHAGFGDSRFTSQRLLRKWQTHVLKNPRFLQASTICQNNIVTTDTSSHRFASPLWSWGGLVVLFLVSGAILQRLLAARNRRAVYDPVPGDVVEPRATDGPSTD
jgi:hypothetical protein